MKSPALILALFLTVASVHASEDWPFWRGPNRDGSADPNQDPPVEFGPEKNLKWSVALPGRAHGSATVVGNRVFIATADETKQIQSVHAFDRETGASLWKTEVHVGGFVQKTNKKASWASGSPACDGERVFINFINGDAVDTTALSVEDGKRLWQTKITGYTVHQGYGSSPTLWKNLVIVSADNKSGGAVAGLDRKTGKIVWKNERAQLPNYASPVILEAAGKPQLFLIGTEKVSSFDPLTGETNWEIDGATTECVSTTVTDGERIFSSGGYPKNHVAAIAADGSGKVVWETNDRVYVPSLLIKDGYLYAAMDSGVAICWDSATGEEKWKARLGGNFTASSVLVGDLIYAPNESGTLYVFKASPDGLEVVAENQLAGEIFATPSICGGEIFLRVADYSGENRSERLVCYGNP
ncbi:MAG: PQQ-binding-like beta-propeller repeat protein [Verrucomicrobiae bacterium]|nr:PQQ-binding-like beta-propeller repeat protein [Verrucomicrobiae bacterium]